MGFDESYIIYCHKENSVGCFSVSLSSLIYPLNLPFLHISKPVSECWTRTVKPIDTICLITGSVNYQINVQGVSKCHLTCFRICPGFPEYQAIISLIATRSRAQVNGVTTKRQPYKKAPLQKGTLQKGTLL